MAANGCSIRRGLRVLCRGEQSHGPNLAVAKRNAVIAIEEYVSWLRECTDENEMPKLISWIETVKPRDLRPVGGLRFSLNGGGSPFVVCWIARFDGADRSFGQCSGGNHAAAAVMMLKARFSLWPMAVGRSCMDALARPRHRMRRSP